MNIQPNYQILACGSNGSFQLGLGDDEDRNQLNHVQADFPRAKPVQFACGGNHTLIRFEDGLVMAAGGNEYSQCGFKGEEFVKQFTKVPGSWRFVAAGWEYSVFVDFEDKVYTCGHGPKGELGLGDKFVLAEELFEVKFERKGKIVDVQSSINHVVVVTEEGTYGWGACRKGQLGQVTKLNDRGKPVAGYWEPERVDISGIAALGHDRTVLQNSQGIEILGKSPEIIETEASSVKAMWSSVHWTVPKDNGIDIFSHGNNLHGQLYKFNEEAKVVDYTVGSEHGLVLLENNKVCAWGWGEHGNCGPPKKGKEEEVTFDYLNEVYGGKEKVVFLAAGCATTWIVVEEAEGS
ncbi:hypothetical protein C7M61_002243 [Candidozyma pseudohaemuli]|uniref:Uncharacterized protein n=1 Tax=Candidozyma pseudohaemuli TaxID=418784 RepID=A0A2P7YSI8_9ASCO|nr:hypothetical protein C7M61_002243 [[Candida] pseudohaemulonii]PSK38937.1 hypothetical protein C7M61_002243 [[Candida] pseudohaemulonii]